MIGYGMMCYDRSTKRFTYLFIAAKNNQNSRLKNYQTHNLMLSTATSYRIRGRNM